MITLQSLTILEDGRFYAKWYDCDDTSQSIGHTVAALHHPDGRPDVANLNIRVPRLTAEQMRQAQPDQHKAYQLAALGIAKQPAWEARYTKAAEIVASNGVTLTSEEAAVVVSTSGQMYAIYGKSCTCKYSQLKREICSHYLAVRMARALGYAIGGDEATRERAAEIRRQANKDAKERRIASRGENIHERNRRQARHDGDGARQYWRMAYANGRMTVSPEIAQRAQQGGD